MPKVIHNLPITGIASFAKISYLYKILTKSTTADMVVREFPTIWVLLT